MSKNLAASVRARLKHHADAAKQDFNLTRLDGVRIALQVDIGCGDTFAKIKFLKNLNL